jgi:CheY-like chemotaxis protein
MGTDNDSMSAATAAPTAILVVEDEFLVRLFAVDALEDAGFRVLPAETATEALRVLRAAPDVRAAVIDMGLPDRSGDHLAAEVRTLRADLPIVIASGRSGRELREQFAQQPRVAVLVKPYTAELLLDALAAVGVTPTDSGSARPAGSPA